MASTVETTPLAPSKTPALARSGEAPTGPVAPANAPVVAAAGPPKKSRAKVILPTLAAVGGAVGLVVYLLGRGKETTDDAQVEGRIESISARVQGQVEKVLVKDNQVVKAGEVLVEIDKRELSARLDAAKADLAAARAQLAAAQAQLALTERNSEASLKEARGGLVQASSALTSTRATLEQSKADVDAAESRFALAEIELKRTKTLFSQGAVAQSLLDNVQNQWDSSKAALEQAHARYTSTLANIAGSSGGIQTAQGRLAAAQTIPQQIAASRASVDLADAKVKQSEAAEALAELNVSYATITAPTDGVVSRRSVEVGQVVAPGGPLLALVPPNDVWVVANFKEDQLGEMRVGQHVKVTIDTYGGRSFSSHIDSIAGASGARFSLLPPDNASGNFVKVVQRIPVLVRFDSTPDLPMRPGMSADVTVYTK